MCPLRPDHPRLRGEHPVGGAGAVQDHPRLRGERPWRVRHPADHPRLRGERPSERGRSAPDHPRLRGERASAVDRQAVQGSPPPARGAPLPDLLLYPRSAPFSFTSEATPPPGGRSSALRCPKRFLRPALLQPVRPYVGAEAIDSGLRIRNTPSLSIGSQWCRCTLNARPCSFRCLYTISARPSLESSTTRAHSKSRTLAVTFPTNTEVISARIGEVTVFEVGEYESCPDEVADSAGAGGGVFQGVPSAGEQGEAAFALGA